MSEACRRRVGGVSEVCRRRLHLLRHAPAERDGESRLERCGGVTGPFSSREDEPSPHSRAGFAVNDWGRGPNSCEATTLSQVLTEERLLI